MQKNKEKEGKKLNKGQIIIKKCSGFVHFMKSGIAQTTEQRCKEEQEMLEADMT